jgi:hypothetical protein
VSQRISLDADPPAVQLDWANLAGGEIGATLKTLAGEANSRPVPVEVDWTTNAHGALASVEISCQHGNGDWYTAFTASAGAFEVNTFYPWSSDDKIHQGSACKVTLAASGPTGIASGRIKVCGSQVATWTAERIASFTATSSACGADTCGTSLKVAGVKGVDLAYTSMLPGSAFVNDAPPAGEVLHLTFDDGPTETGVPSFSDASGTGLTGACSATGCPAPGQQGHLSSAALFDGADDVVRLGRYTPSNLATVSAWIRPMDATKTRETIVSLRENASCGFVLNLQNGSNGYPEFYVSYLDSSNVYRWRSISQSVAVSKDRWTHLAAVYDGTYMYLYRDGALVAQSGSLPGRIYDWCGTQIGVGARSDYVQHFFPGRLDDVRIFNRRLSAAEVKALYTGSGPLLALSFEKPWVTDGANLSDDSGWGHDATLYTGTSDTANKAGTGQVGNYALTLDGLDDYANAGSPVNLANSSFSVAFWAKRNAPNRNDFVISQGTSGTSTLLHLGFRSTNEFTCAFYYNDLNTVKDTDTGWHHWTCTYDAATNARTIYRDGVKAVQDFPLTDCQGSGELYIGRYSTDAFYGGAVDDLRIYQRVLPAQEIADLYHAGWHAASLTQSGDTVESTKWTANVPSGPVGATTPPGLEGAYRIEMRGTDVAGHSGAVRDREALWNGDANTLAPRVTLTKKGVNATYQYATVAEDYNLVETGLSSPCGSAGTVTREYFKSPWYVTSGGEQKLYRLALDCTLTSPAAYETATACDSYNNCTTSGVTAAAEIESEGDTETEEWGKTETREDSDVLRVPTSPRRSQPGQAKVRHHPRQHGAHRHTLLRAAHD